MEFTRSALFELVWSTPMTAIARQYGVHHQDVAKACDKYNIARPKAGYWEKVRNGKAVDKAELDNRRFRPDDIISIRRRELGVRKPRTGEAQRIADLIQQLIATGCDPKAVANRYCLEEPYDPELSARVHRILVAFGPRDHLRAEIVAYLRSEARVVDIEANPFEYTDSASVTNDATARSN